MLEKKVKELVEKYKKTELENQKLKLLLKKMEKENLEARKIFKKCEIYENERKIIKEKIIQLLGKISYYRV